MKPETEPIYNKPTCCEKCFNSPFNSSSPLPCKNNICECHWQKASQPETGNSMEWEKEFNRLFVVKEEDGYWINVSPVAVTAFIRSLLAEKDAEIKFLREEAYGKEK